MFGWVNIDNNDKKCWQNTVLILFVDSLVLPQIARFMGPTWGPPGSCRPQVGSILATWTLLSGTFKWDCSLSRNIFGEIVTSFIDLAYVFFVLSLLLFNTFIRIQYCMSLELFSIVPKWYFNMLIVWKYLAGPIKFNLNEIILCLCNRIFILLAKHRIIKRILCDALLLIVAHSRRIMYFVGGRLFTIIQIPETIDSTWWATRQYLQWHAFTVKSLTHTHQVPRFKCFFLVLLLSLVNPLKPGVRSRMEM